jgi:hypothetical protein
MVELILFDFLHISFGEFTRQVDRRFTANGMKQSHIGWALCTDRISAKESLPTV